jgi:hypothetical protein
METSVWVIGLADAAVAADLLDRLCPEARFLLLAHTLFLPSLSLPFFACPPSPQPQRRSSTLEPAKPGNKWKQREEGSPDGGDENEEEPANDFEEPFLTAEQQALMEVFL